MLNKAAEKLAVKSTLSKFKYSDTGLAKHT